MSASSKKGFEKQKLIISFAVNLLIVALELVGVIMNVTGSSKEFFRYYTQDSNVLALIACSLCAFFTARKVFAGKSIPRWVLPFKYIAACCTALTFVIVITVLAPPEGIAGYRFMLFHNELLFVHFLCPVLCVLSFVLFEHFHKITLIDTLYAMIPTVLYGAVVIILNLAGILVGPYRFLMVYEQPLYMSVIWTVLILSVAYLIAWALRHFNRILFPRTSVSEK